MLINNSRWHQPVCRCFWSCWYWWVVLGYHDVNISDVVNVVNVVKCCQPACFTPRPAADLTGHHRCGFGHESDTLQFPSSEPVEKRVWWNDMQWFTRAHMLLITSLIKWNILRWKEKFPLDGGQHSRGSSGLAGDLGDGELSILVLC